MSSVTWEIKLITKLKCLWVNSGENKLKLNEPTFTQFEKDRKLINIVKFSIKLLMQF
jgi:hypothetical protein